MPLPGALPRTPQWRAVRSWGVRAGAILVPWSWFVVRRWRQEFDFIAIGLPLVVLAACLVLVATAVIWRRAFVMVALASWLAFGAVAVLGPMRARPGPAPIDAVTITAANTGAAIQRRAVADTLLADAADVLIAVELQRDTHAFIEAGGWDSVELSPTAARERNTDNLSIGVYTNLPTEQLEVPPGFPGIRVLIDRPVDPFVLYAVHVPKPSVNPTRFYDVTFGRHRDIIAVVRDAVRSETMPVVLAGDLNASDRGGDYALIDAELKDAMRSTTAGPTSVRSPLWWRALLLRVDHIFISNDWCAEGGRRFSIPSADHRAVSVRVGRCPDAP